MRKGWLKVESSQAGRKAPAGIGLHRLYGLSRSSKGQQIERAAR